MRKYRAIAEGQPHDGRYKHLSVEDIFWSETESLKAIAEVDTLFDEDLNKAIKIQYDKIAKYVPSLLRFYLGKNGGRRCARA